MTLLAATHPLLISLFIVVGFTALVVYWEKKKFRDMKKRNNYPKIGKIKIHKDIEQTLDEFERKIS